MSMGSKLAQARKKANLTQEQLAERLGVTRQAVSRWESDTAYPETDKIVRMAELLEVSCDYLLKDGVAEDGKAAPGPVTRLLRDAVGRRVKLSLYEGENEIFGGKGVSATYDWCAILDFDEGWANVEFVKEKKDQRETRLIPLSDIRAVTFLKENGKEA